MATSKQSSKKRPGVRQLKHAVGSKESQDAIRLLKADHREVEALFKTFKRTESTAEKQAIAKKICDALKIHTRIEEEVFYPAFKERADRDGLQTHSEALAEHHAVETSVIPEVHAAEPGTPDFAGRTKVFGAGILSSIGEIPFSLSSSVERRPFVTDEVIATDPGAFDMTRTRVSMAASRPRSATPRSCWGRAGSMTGRSSRR